MNSKKKYLRSPLFYVGDKFKLLPEILNHFPNKIDKFIEPFVGGGSVFLNTNAKSYLLNDVNSRLIDIHRYLVSCNSKPEEFYKSVETIISEYNLSKSYKRDIIPEELKKRLTSQPMSAK